MRASPRAAVVVEAAQPILIGAEAAKDRPAHRCFNGKIEAPAIAGIAAWDFSRRMESLEVEDTGPNGLHGRLVNLPTRAMKGARWTGAERDWKQAPHQYAAIHFHDDDLHDCGWDDSFSFTVPDGPEERRLRHGAVVRDAPRHHPVLRAARDRQADGEGRLSRLDLHLSGLHQLPARPVQRRLPR